MVLCATAILWFSPLCLQRDALAASDDADCPVVDDNPPPAIYSREDVRTGRLPETVALTRAILQVGGEAVDVVIVTDAARAQLDDSWPLLAPQTRLMLVVLETGRLLWEWVQWPQVRTGETHAADPRLHAAMGAAAVLRRSDGLAQRLYVGDKAARVWRIDLPPLSNAQNAATDWHLSLLADLAPANAAPSVQFRLAPDLVRSLDSQGAPFDGVLMASEGALPGPLNHPGNGVFFLRDYAVETHRRGESLPAVIIPSDLAPARDPRQPGAGAGWFARFQHPLEVAKDRPLTDGGRVFLVTSLPALNCDDDPLALTYVFNLSDGRAANNTLAGSVAGLGYLGGPVTEGAEIVLPGRGVAMPGAVAGDEAGFRARFTAEAIFARLVYWRDLLLDAD